MHIRLKRTLNDDDELRDHSRFRLAARWRTRRYSVVHERRDVETKSEMTVTLYKQIARCLNRKQTKRHVNIPMDCNYPAMNRTGTDELDR